MQRGRPRALSGAKAIIPTDCELLAWAVGAKELGCGGSRLGFGGGWAVGDCGRRCWVGPGSWGGLCLGMMGWGARGLRGCGH